MTSFKPGDRVVYMGGFIRPNGLIGYVKDVFQHSVFVEFNEHHSAYLGNSYLRPAYQTCADCNGSGWVYYVGGGDCLTCKGTGRINRTGPYRRSNGKWSDGVDRTCRIDWRAVSDRIEVTVRWSRGRCFEASFRVWKKGLEVEEPFPTLAEAINYAHKVAREVTG